MRRDPSTVQTRGYSRLVVWALTCASACGGARPTGERAAEHTVSGRDQTPGSATFAGERCERSDRVRDLVAETIDVVLVINPDGQVHSVTKEDAPVTARVPLPGPALQVVSNELEACALLADLSVYCWGTSISEDMSCPWHGPTPRRVAADAVFVGVYATRFCALGVDGAVECWGWLAFAPDPFTSEEYACEPSDARIRATDGCSGVARSHTLCWSTGGQVYCRSSGFEGWPAAGVSLEVLGLEGAERLEAPTAWGERVCAWGEWGRGAEFRCCLIDTSGCESLSLEGTPTGLALGARTAEVLTTAGPRPMPWASTPIDLDGRRGLDALAAGTTSTCVVYRGAVRARCPRPDGQVLVIEPDGTARLGDWTD